MRLQVFLVIMLSALLAAGPASAATMVYPVSHFGNAGVANPNRLLGNTPNASNIDRNDSIGLNFGADISGYSVSFTVTAFNNRTTWIWVRPGRWNGVTFVSATGTGLLGPNGLPTINFYAQIVGPGVYRLPTVAFDANCQLIGGCNAIVFGNSSFSQTGSTFGLSVVGSSPEPRAWALMILGFAGVAARLKQMRRSSLEPARSAA